MIKKFDWNVKEKPEDFIVKEIGEHQIDKKGDFYLYRLIKKNLNTREITQKLNLSYAGLKDKNAITFQYVTSTKYLGENLFNQSDKNKFYILSFLGKTRKKLKIGQLKGNYFSIKLKSDIKLKKNMINYFDTQRLSNNIELGKKFFEKIDFEKISRKKLTWKINFYIDAYLSYLWNKSFEMFLKEIKEGYYIEENRHNFFIPKEINIDNLPKFWTILGYKVKLEQSKDYYREILKKEGFDLTYFLEVLKHLRIKGDYRKSYITVENVKLSKNYIHFYLPKGAYATMYLKHIYKI